jgi:putative ABC transport system permease protein
MFKNYLKIAFRNLIKNKTFSLINISGLAIGLTCTILILLWIQHELSYDRFHDNLNELYRVVSVWDDGSRGACCPGPAAKVMKEEFPEILNSTRYTEIRSLKLSYQQKNLMGTVHYVDASFFNMFTFPFIQGNSEMAFSDPNSIILTENMAHRMFGEMDPIGKTIHVDDGRHTVKVSGVIKNIPVNSHIKADFFLPVEIGYESWKVWDNNAPHIYVLLQKNSSYQEISRKIAHIRQQYNPKAKEMSITATFELQPLSQVHLYSLNGGGPITYVYIFSAMAIVILLIACINFMNLATARSTQRIKEISIRKVVGSTRSQLIGQFLYESILLSFLAFGLALLIVELLNPSFNQLIGQQLQMDYRGNLFISLLGIAFITGCISGSYPAFFLSSFSPALMFKKYLPLVSVFRKKSNQLMNYSKSFGLRKVLVIIQFSLSIGFIICSLLIYYQLHYIKNKELGFDKDQILMLKMQGELREKYDLVKTELLQNPNILSISGAEPHPVIQDGETGIIHQVGNTEQEGTWTYLKWIDYDYLKTFDMKLAEGRFFSKEFPTDASNSSPAWLVNEKAVEEMGTNNPIGQECYFNFYFGRVNGRIIGVIKNFHNESLHDEIRPITFMLISGNRFANMSIKIKAENITNTISFIENKMKELVPSYIFQYNFLDEEIDTLYKTDQLTSKLVAWATFLAIFISCLGLLGLAMFTVEQKRKEIGIRKVVGASVFSILKLFTKDITKWVLLANIIAWPFAYCAMNKWLQNFAYRIDMSWWIFALAGGLALLIALLTVSWQAIRAAIANPVDALRYE